MMGVLCVWTWREEGRAQQGVCFFVLAAAAAAVFSFVRSFVRRRLLLFLRERARSKKEIALENKRDAFLCFSVRDGFRFFPCWLGFCFVCKNKRVCVFFKDVLVWFCVFNRR
jgi:hypothetical protein